MKHIMTQLKNSAYKNAIISFTVILVGSLIIWFAGPHIKHLHLASAGRRVYLLALVFLIWGVSNFAFKDKWSVSKINALLKAATKNLPQTAETSKIHLARLPWYLLIGPSGSGKSTLLSNANVNFVLKNHLDQNIIETIAKAQNLDWWVTPDNVILDVPGTYLTPGSEEEAVASSTPWDELFQKKPANAVQGVVVALPLNDLTDREACEQFTSNLKIRIKQLQEKFGSNLAFYFTVTKCDLLPGFLEFFNNSGSDELSQAWGVTMPTVGNNQTLVETFSNRFNALISRLNKQLIWRLHQEMGSFERVFIKDFPLQVEHLKVMLVEILKTLSTAETNLNLQGVYMTSAMQHGAEEQVQVQKHLTTNESMTSLQIMQTPVMPSRSYFIRQFIMQALIAPHAELPKLWQKRSSVYALCASTIAITIAFLGYDIFYEKNNKDKTIEVSSFNIVMPQAAPAETKVGDSLTIVS
jgi:type VI secretion system protein ImpL